MNVNAYYVPNPVSQKMLEIEPEPSGDGSIVFIGRLVDKKGVRLLPKLARLLDRKIHVIGHGPLEGWLLQHKPFNIVYHGFTYDEAKFNILKKASVLIAPSLCFEMWNYTVTEAFIVGKPVVAFELGGLKEQIEASGGGFLVPPFNINCFAEKVLILVENTNMAKYMGLKGRKWVEENLCPSRYGEALAKVYHDAIMR